MWTHKQSQPGAGDLTNSHRPDGLRHRRTDSSGTTQVLWDGDDPLAQVDTAGNLIEYWSRADRPLPGENWSRLVKDRFPTSNANPDQYVHGDWLGTVVALSLPNGTALARNGATPRVWGEQDSSTTAPLSWLGNHGYWAERQLRRPEIMAGEVPESLAAVWLIDWSASGSFALRHTALGRGA